MIRSTTEIVQWGVERLADEISTLYVVNDGTGDHETGNYNVYTIDPRGKKNPTDGWMGRIEGFTREWGHHRLMSYAHELVWNFGRNPWCPARYSPLILKSTGWMTFYRCPKIHLMLPSGHTKCGNHGRALIKARDEGRPTLRCKSCAR